MSVLVLSEHEVRALLTMDECIEAMDEVLRSLARGELHQPLRPMTRPDGHDEPDGADARATAAASSPSGR